MSLHRRDFMKILGVSVASLFLSRCRAQTAEPTETIQDQPTCYEAPAPTDLPTLEPTNIPTRQRLRLYWLRFGELAESSREDTEDKFGQELIAGHRAILDELVTSEEVSASAADLVQEAYSAAVYHVWRSSAPITCYAVMGPLYDADSASMLVSQAAILNQLAEQGQIDPNALAKAKAALEHDMSFYALSDKEVQDLYQHLLAGAESGSSMPSFEALDLELTPEAKEATQFLIDLLMGK